VAFFIFDIKVLAGHFPPMVFVRDAELRWGARFMQVGSFGDGGGFGKVD